MKKLFFSEEAWDNLHNNVIETRKEFIELLQQGYFDIILLSDCDASFFIKPHSIRRKIRAIADFIYRFFHFGVNLSRKHYAYEHCMPYTLSELRKFAPVAAIDLSEPACLSQSGRRVFEESTLFFKRELPYDRYFMYYPDRPAPWKEWRKKLLPFFDKVYGIPLGIEDDKYFALKRLRHAEKDIDVFISGAVSNTQRKTAIALLDEIRAEKEWNIVMLDHVSFDEYCELVARSKVTISIGGSRWECFRHYEAVALGSVPLMNRPNIDAVWWNDLPEAIFFENNFSNFCLRIDELLTKSELREECFTQLEKRIEGDMLHSTVLDYVVSKMINFKKFK
ncbi:hypothetical protein [Candidatus Electrothrix sp.]|uniref:hypothetical protein n=1 Tax=Candidatus Electrothrix sp. TaxID=2170559 RepID=UPI004055BD8B